MSLHSNSAIGYQLRRTLEGEADSVNAPSFSPMLRIYQLRWCGICYSLCGSWLIRARTLGWKCLVGTILYDSAFVLMCRADQSLMMPTDGRDLLLTGIFRQHLATLLKPKTSESPEHSPVYVCEIIAEVADTWEMPHDVNMIHMAQPDSGIT